MLSQQEDVELAVDECVRR